VRSLLIAAVCASVAFVGGCTTSDDELESSSPTPSVGMSAVALADALLTEEDVAAAIGSPVDPDLDTSEWGCGTSPGGGWYLGWKAGVGYIPVGSDLLVVECITTSPNAERIFADVAEEEPGYLPYRVLREVDPGGPNEPAQVRSDMMVRNAPDGRMVLVKDGDTLIHLLVVDLGPSPDTEMLPRGQIDQLVATAVGNLPS